MKLAESVRLRWVLAAASIACAASATAIIASHHAALHAPVVIMQRHELPVVGGCHQRHKHVEVTAHAPTPPETTGDKYGDALLAIRPALDACMKKSSSDVTYRVSANIGTDGSVLSVDVRSEAKDMRKVSLKTTQCLERAVQTATFPTSTAPTRVSTVLRP